MKKISLLLLVLVFVLSCNNSSNKEAELPVQAEIEDVFSLEGSWELIGYYNYINNKVSDSFNSNPGYRQVKIYTPTRVMWSKLVPLDSTEWYGYGNYKITDTSLVEILEYGSTSMEKIIKDKKEFNYELHLEKDKFSQIEVDPDGNRIYSENYERID